MTLRSLTILLLIGIVAGDAGGQDTAGLGAAMDSVRKRLPAGARVVFLVVEVDKPVVIIPGTERVRYPERLRKERLAGHVVVAFVVDTTGRADMSTFKVLESNHRLFENAVRDGVQQTRYLPAEIGGRKVRQLVKQPFDFAPF